MTNKELSDEKLVKANGGGKKTTLVPCADYNPVSHKEIGDCSCENCIYYDCSISGNVFCHYPNKMQ